MLSRRGNSIKRRTALSATIRATAASPGVSPNLIDLQELQTVSLPPIEDGKCDAGHRITGSGLVSAPIAAVSAANRDSSHKNSS